MITYYGTTIIDQFTKVAAPVVVLLIIFICVVLIKDFGFSESVNTAPAGVETTRRNYMLAVEVACGVGFSWPFLFSAYTKPALSENAAYTPTVIGSGVIWAICCIAPAITSALTGESDPVIALSQIGGGYAIIWLVMLTIANLSSVMINPYFLSCSLNAMFPKLKWRTCVLVQCLYLVPIFFPIFYDRFGTVISFIGIVEATAGCIWALDYFLNKRINLRHCYATGERRKQSAYWYVCGFNPCTWGGLIVGSAFGFIHYNPWTGAIRFGMLFDFLGAMIPAAIVGTIVYFILYTATQKKWRQALDMHMTVEEYAKQKHIA